ncbi:hypothetical protein [Rhizobium ruizarguesonis]|uniref:Toprim domain-containing protein n=1 Tax=Rhizobium ruizarguesonis TaxID=2081791 RepID=A0AB38HSF3_9HYPH|nr:hypothetical protein [Rhizobium ruizarguesonis]TBC03027.1 hypothetical protein ELH40_36145 [Rhizobium ruizarguesonis]
MGRAPDCYGGRNRPADDTATVEPNLRSATRLNSTVIVVSILGTIEFIREQGLPPKIRRRFVATIDNDQKGQISPNFGKEVLLSRTVAPSSPCKNGLKMVVPGQLKADTSER